MSIFTTRPATLALRLTAAVAVLTLAACSSTKHVPKGQYLLDNVKIDITDKQNNHGVDTKPLFNFLRQTENHKVLGGLKLQLALYNLSGRDSTSRFNRWLQRIGTPPVIYDSTLTIASANQLRRAMYNKGYLNAEVSYDTQLNEPKKKAKVNYHITLNEPYLVRSVSYDIADDTLRHYILADTAQFPVKPGTLLDYNKLNSERETIARSMRNNGYFAFNKDHISFIADTAANSREVDLTLVAKDWKPTPVLPYVDRHRQFRVRNVIFVTSYDPVAMQDGYYGVDTVNYKGITVMNGTERYLRPQALYECCYLHPGEPYRLQDVNNTYKALSRLGILKYVNIEMRPVGELAGELWLDAYVLLARDKSQSISLSLEGTNSEGDLGFGIGADYQHRNIFGGSELFNLKFKTSYESLSGDLSGLINDNYSEYSVDAGLSFPKFMFPLLRERFKKRIQASTNFTASFNYQARPEYTRIIAGASWKYVWSERNNQQRHTFKLLDFSYVYLPKSKASFLDSISTPLLLYSYTNHFIMLMGYSYYKTNKLPPGVGGNVAQDHIYTIRASVETAGNLLYGISNLVGQKKGEDDTYKIGNISYAQYFKVNSDFSYTKRLNARSSLAFHAGLGIAVPYGNSTAVPFEKSFYSGGANSVRGWGVRTLGPGSYNGDGKQNSFIYQCGDVRLDLNIEYRMKLFWLLEMGLFVDAGNVWSIRDYDDQPGGVFKFNKFAEQIALSYGLGLRLDFNYFLVRLDMGMKAHNPASGQEHWPIFSPKFKRDAEFHFSIGYPF